MCYVGRECMCVGARVCAVFGMQSFWCLCSVQSTVYVVCPTCAKCIWDQCSWVHDGVHCVQSTVGGGDDKWDWQPAIVLLPHSPHFPKTRGRQSQWHTPCSQLLKIISNSVHLALKKTIPPRNQWCQPTYLKCSSFYSTLNFSNILLVNIPKTRKQGGRIGLGQAGRRGYSEGLQ